MKAFCSFWLCRGKGNAEEVDRECGIQVLPKASLRPGDGSIDARKEDGSKQGRSASFASEDRDSAKGHERRSGSCRGDPSAGKRAGAGALDSAALTALAPAQLQNERTLRALLHKAKQVLMERSELQQQRDVRPLAADEVSCASTTKAAGDADLQRLNAQLLEICRTPRPDSRCLLRLELTLSEVRRWLAARPHPAAATAVLYAAGDSLMYSEHAVRSGGQVRFWQPNNVAAFRALLQLYGDLLHQATRAARHSQQQQQQHRGSGHGQGCAKGASGAQPVPQNVGKRRDTHDSDPDQLPAAPSEQLQLQPSEPSIDMMDSGLFGRSSGLAGGGGGAGQAAAHGQQCASHPPHPRPQHPLTFAMAALLLRPEWLDLLSEALELLHFSQEYGEAARREGREPQEALAAALELWGFLTQLVKFAAQYADSVQRMTACLQRLATLLTPPSGAVPRLLALPIGEDTLVAQLNVLWLLQVLYDMPDAKVLYVPSLADHYVALHHGAMVRHYEASAADPKSASAELCRIHATLLRSLARHPGHPVRAAFSRARTVEWILGEVSLESQLLPGAQAEGGDADEDDEEDEEDESGEDEEDESSSNSDRLSAGSRRGEVGQQGQGARERAAPAPEAAAGTGTAVGGHASKASRAFEFTYDLNEDVERLLAMEDEMGEEMALEGFEYDEEGRQLKARSDARLAAAAAAEADAASAAAAAAAAAEKKAAPSALGKPPVPPRLRLPTETEDPATAQQEPVSPVHGGEEAAAAAAATGAPRDAGRRVGSQCSFAASSPSQRSGNVPRLALSNLRTLSISSMAGRSPAARRPSVARRTSNTNSNLGGASSRVEEEEEEEGDGRMEEEEGEEEEDLLVRTRTPDTVAAAAAAERVATWSTTLVEAYAAAANGDPSRMPHPPPRTRSNANASAPHLADTSTVPAQGAGGVGGVGVGRTSPSQRSPKAPGPGSGGPRELTTGSPVHAGPQGELHIMVHTTGSGAGAGSAARPGHAHGRPPLPNKPALPPLKVSAAGSEPPAGAAGPVAQSPTTSARAPPPGSSRAMVLLSASNRAHVGATSPSPSSTHAQQPAPWAPTTSPVRDLNRQFSALSASEGVPPAPAQQPGGDTAPGEVALGPTDALALTGTATAAGVGGDVSPRRPQQPLIPALNLKSLRRRDGGGPTTDTGRTLPLSAMLRSTNAGSLSHCSGMDSANTLLPTGSSNVSTATAAAAAAGGSDGGAAGARGASARGSAAAERPLDCIAEADARPPEVAYQEAACQRLLYQDRSTHILLLKTLLDLLVSPTGALDPAYVPQYPAHNAVPHAEYVLLWHLNAPRNTGVVHDLCRGAQRRARQLAAAAAAAGAGPVVPASSAVLGDVRVSSASSSSAAVSARAATAVILRLPSTYILQPYDSARDRATPPNAAAPPSTSAPIASIASPAAAAAVTAPAAIGGAAATFGRAAGIVRALQFLSRPLFDANRYTNLQFVARGAFGDIYRARMEPPRATAWPSPSPQLHAGGGSPGLATAAGAAGVVIGSAAAAGLSSSPPSSSAAAAAGAVAATQVVIKTISLPGSPHDSCILADVFGEVSIMERFAGHDCICQLLDYGMRDDAYWIVMRRYRCSLAEWRARQRPLGGASSGNAGAPAPAAASAATAAAAARVYLSALLQIVDALRLLAAHHVVHFDLKCSNVLIEPLAGVRDGELWAPVGAPAPAPAPAAAAKTLGCVPFRCVLADFGEARAYRCAEEAFTARNRGTEVFKSPEMLMLNAGRGGQGAAGATSAAAAPMAPAPSPRPASSRPAPAPATTPAPVPVASPGRSTTPRPVSAAARQPNTPPLPQPQSLAGAGLASDIWSLGCLTFELLSGTVLFSGDYASVTHRVAFGAGERMTLTDAERARLGGLPPLVELVEWILVRDPAKRPSLERIRERVERVRAELAVVAAGDGDGAGGGAVTGA